jgi:hypothetical protein
MGSANGLASTVVSRAESPVYAGGFRQSNAFCGGLSVLNRSVECISLGSAQCWCIGGVVEELQAACHPLLLLGVCLGTAIET